MVRALGRASNSLAVTALIKNLYTRITLQYIQEQQETHHIQTTLHIDVAERTRSGRHSVSDSDCWGIDTQVNDIIQSPVSARRRVIQGNSSSNSVLSLRDILVLPDPPCAIDLSVVQEESGISWGSEDVSTRVTTDGKVTSSVYSVEAGCEVALHDRLEGSNIRVLRD